MRAAASATAIAHPNIALVKYWGKRDDAANLPAVGSLSLTLDALATRTTVRFDSGLAADELRLDGKPDEPARRRVSRCLDLLRARAGTAAPAQVWTQNDFPTGAGLASSASGFAALVVAGAAALGLDLPADELAGIARIGSGSAPRSLHGGFAVLRNLPSGAVVCEPLLAAGAWPLRVIVAVTSPLPKEVGSRDGMRLSRETSPYYEAWVHSHPPDLAAAEEAVRRRDFPALATVAEASCLKMHAVMMATRPPLLYWTAATVAAMEAVRTLRRAGTDVFFTVDAGPQVKAVSTAAAAPAVMATLAAVPGVTRLIDSGLGHGARCIDPTQR